MTDKLKTKTDDLQKGTIDESTLTAKYLKEHGQAIAKINEEVVKQITDQLFNEKEVQLLRKVFDEKQLKEIKDKNVG